MIGSFFANSPMHHSECSCGRTFDGGQWLPDSVCQQPCTGNSSQTCGGVYPTGNLDLYNTSIATVTPATQLAAHSPGWLGCFDDKSTVRVAFNYTYTASTVNINTCQSACAGFGYGYAMLSAGNICKCGTAAPATQQLPASFCTTPCAANSKTNCGGKGYVDAYDISHVNDTATSKPSGYIGCSTDPNGAGLTTFVYSDKSMTPAVCMQSCKELGHAVSGVENGQECHCGAAMNGGQVMPDSVCTSPCSGEYLTEKISHSRLIECFAGDATQICGGYRYISLYNSSMGAAIPAKPAGWVGCYTDSAARTFTGYNYTAGGLSPRSCQVACGQKGFALAALESNVCFCDNQYRNGGSRVNQAQCNYVCSGNANATCGGYWRMDVLATEGIEQSTNGLAGYRGCYSDINSMSYAPYSSDYQDPGMCAGQCAARGYAYSGLLAGKTCRCGNTSPSALVARTNCQQTQCTANPSAECGGASAISVYNVDKTDSTAYRGQLATNGSYGCWVGNFPLLSGYKYQSTAMTVNLCIAQCSAIGSSVRHYLYEAFRMKC